jgi:hypothetical protein
MKQELQRDEVKSSGAEGMLEFFSHSAPHLMHLTRNLFIDDICPRFHLAVHRGADAYRSDEWGNLFQQGAGRPFLPTYCMMTHFTAPYIVCQENNKPHSEHCPRSRVKIISSALFCLTCP